MASLDEWYLYSEIVSPDYAESLDENFKGIIIVCRDVCEPIGYLEVTRYAFYFHTNVDEETRYKSLDDLYKEYDNNLTLRLLEFK